MVAVVTSLRHRPKDVTSTPSFDVDTGIGDGSHAGARVAAVATRSHGRMDLVDGIPPIPRCLRDAGASRSSSVRQRYTKKTTSPERVSCTPVRAVTSSGYRGRRFET